MVKLIGVLPKALEVDGELYRIDSDFRTALLIMQVYNSTDLSDLKKHETMLRILYTTEDEETGELIADIPHDTTKAVRAAMDFLNYGSSNDSDDDDENKDYDDEFGDIAKEIEKNKARTIDYAYDERLIFSAINPIYARDIREDDYMHWYTFCDLCMSIDGDSLIAQIVAIRKKISEGKKLDKHEVEFYRKNPKLIEIPGAYGMGTEKKDNDLRKLERWLDEQ